MRIFSYRNRIRLKRLLIILLCLLLAAIALIAGYAVFLSRYVVYTSDGAWLDLPWEESGSTETDAASVFVSGELVMDSSITRETMPSDTEIAETAVISDEPVSGYTIDPADLSDASEILDLIDEELAEAEAEGEDLTEAAAALTVMITVKSTSGTFYYNSDLGDCADCADITEELIAGLAERGISLTARLPAFADSAFALENQSIGLPITGGALWMDSSGNYWLDPTSSTAQDYLVSICQELRALGFSEIVFSEFAFPDSSSIIYDSDYTRDELTVQAAESVTGMLASSGLTLSFLTDDTESAFAAVACADRIYLELDEGSSVTAVAELYTDLLDDISLQLVFVTESRDTRFEDYGVLRPIS